MKAREIGQIIGRQGEFDLTRGKLRKISLSTQELLVVLDTQPVTQDASAGIAVCILADTILIQRSTLLAIDSQKRLAGR